MKILSTTHRKGADRLWSDGFRKGLSVGAILALFVALCAMGVWPR